VSGPFNSYVSRVEAPYTILEHPADLGIEARGASLVEAFQNAAAGLISIILDPTLIEPREERQIRVTASDRDQLLVKWLSEILYLYDGEGFASKEFFIRRLGLTDVEASVRGEPFSPVRHQTRLDVKAVTYHQLLVHEGEPGALVRVYLDI